MPTPPPEPRGPPIWHRIRYMRDPIGYIDECRRTLGDAFMLRLVGRGMVIACTPELARAVYTASEDDLVAGEAKIAIFGKLLGNSSTLLLDGTPHLDRRRLLLPQFRGEVMQRFAPVMREACRRNLDTMPTGERFALHPFLHRIAFDVIAHALFSSTPAARFDPLTAAMREFAHIAVTSRLLMFPALQRDFGRRSPWGRVLRAVDAARTHVLDEIADRRRNARYGDDITGLLLAARADDGSPLTDLEIRDEILTMVAAGHETTAMALAWACYAIFSRPAIVDRLVDEIAGRDADDVDKLPYLDAVIRESLRFYSLIPNGSGRIAKRSFQLGGYDIPAGAMVSVAFHAVHRGAAFERGDEFWPERFLDTKYSPYESVAFGGGTRRCLGMPFALFEIKIVLASLLSQFGIDIVQERVEPVWRGAFLTPSKGLVVMASRIASRPGRRRDLEPEHGTGTAADDA